MEAMGEKKRACVTGAGGYIASWLVKLLLSKGYIVHGTVRDPSDEKNAHLKKFGNASENLLLFKADLLNYNNIASAIAGCGGVFHVASPVPSTKVPNPEVDVVNPSVSGTLNVLKACSKTEVKRVVVVSSSSAVIRNQNWLRSKIIDEEYWSDKEYCRTTENWYCLDKICPICKMDCTSQSKRACFAHFIRMRTRPPISQGPPSSTLDWQRVKALEYEAKNGLDVVTVLPRMAIGPMLQSTVNASSLIIINVLKGAMGSIENNIQNFVDARDVADALLLVYEKPEASGHHICASHSVRICDMVDMLKNLYPNYKYPKILTEGGGSVITSRKLQMLGWKGRPLEETA